MTNTSISSSELCWETERLMIRNIRESDAGFMHKLMNTRGWLDFIGDRRIKSLMLARKYIIGLLQEDKNRYFVVVDKQSDQEAGVLSLVRRDYLEHEDLGFAFLPQFQRKGMAYEAASSLLERLKTREQTILAVTTPENIASQALIKKLGFRFYGTIVRLDEPLLSYSYSIS